MSGGLLQLVAYGAQDVYLTGNSQITFFKNTHRRYTNFSKESIMQVFDGNTDFGKSVSCTLARNGDLVSDLWLEVELPEITTTEPSETEIVLQNFDYYDTDNSNNTIDGTTPFNGITFEYDDASNNLKSTESISGEFVYINYEDGSGEEGSPHPGYLNMTYSGSDHYLGRCILAPNSFNDFKTNLNNEDFGIQNLQIDPYPSNESETMFNIYINNTSASNESETTLYHNNDVSDSDQSTGRFFEITLGNYTLFLERHDSSDNYWYIGIGELDNSDNYVGYDLTWDGSDNSGAQTGEYIVANLVTNIKANDSVTFYARIHNLTDEYYQTVDGYATAGRSLYVGLVAKY